MATTNVEPQGVHEIGLDRQNKASLGRLLGYGSLGRAQEGPDGIMRASVRIPLDELAWEPSVIVMPHSGRLELEIVNDDAKHALRAATEQR